MKAKPKLCVCIGCGCDDLHACRVGFLEDEACSWLVQSSDKKLGVCSSFGCAGYLESFRLGNRKLSAKATLVVAKRARAARVHKGRRRRAA